MWFNIYLHPNSTVLNKKYGSLVTTTNIDTEVIVLFDIFMADFWVNLDQRFVGYSGEFNYRDITYISITLCNPLPT